MDPTRARETGGAAAPGRWRRRGLAALAGLAAVLVFAGGWFALRESHRDEAEARRALAAGDWEKAERSVSRLLARAPDSGDAYLLLARVGLARNRPEIVEESLRRARQAQASESELAIVRALIAAKQGRPDAAEPVLSRAFGSARGPDPLLDELLAKLYIETYHFARALPVLERWGRDAPRDARPYSWRVEVDRRLGAEPAALIADYREALRRDPDFAEARIGLADELRGAHRNDQAEVEYRAYLAARPEDPVAHYGAACNALELGKEAEAVRHLERVLTLLPDEPRARGTLAEIHLRRGEGERALYHVDRALKAEPFEVNLHYTRALALARLGRDEEAKAEHGRVARLKADRRRLEELQRRLVRAPLDAGLQCQVATWLLDHGHPEEGIRWAEKALRDQPGDPGACRILAEYHERSGRKGLANYYRLRSRDVPAAGAASGP